MKATLAMMFLLLSLAIFCVVVFLKQGKNSVIIHFFPFGVAEPVTALLLFKDVPDYLSGCSYGLFCFIQPNYNMHFIGISLDLVLRFLS